MEFHISGGSISGRQVKRGMRLLCAGAAEKLPYSLSAGTAVGSASEDVPRIGKRKKRVSWRTGSLDDVAQASSSHAGLATAEEMAQEQHERFTWKVLHLSLHWASMKNSV